jgi:S-adenosylmethionine:tRNA ribosyltransferase-isomerase
VIKIEDFDYQLPRELIAQEPLLKRDECRLLVVDKGQIEHKHFYDLEEMLTSNDVLVVNRSKVIPARILGKKKTGGKAEVFLLKKIKTGRWEVLTKNLKVGEVMVVANEEIRIVAKGMAEFDFDEEKLFEFGRTPLPPYIKSSGEWRNEYQTVYAREKGSVAAPTAGLHFTPNLLIELKDKGVIIEEVVLHVGLGTFGQIDEKNILEKRLHEEKLIIDKDTWNRLGQYKKEGKRIIAVGTTALRALESGPNKKKTSIFIYPPYKFKMVDSLITNFHLPKSSLLMLVAALMGEKWREVYLRAIDQKYRFFSFGDAMWIR